MSAAGAGRRAPTALGVREAAQAIAEGRLSPGELVAAFLERIEATAEPLNAFRTVLAEEARAAAADAEHAVERGEPLGPLHGVPIGLKDNIAVEGVPMTASTAVLRDNVADHDANVVMRLRAAGAIIVGKMHMAEWAIGGTTQNLHFGPARNPWDTARVAGGSSGGSGAAVAADLLPVTLGSDTGGSIRIPAALNGITGLRPTAGRVSNHGTIPVAWTFDTVGPMARRAEDVACVLGVIAGYDPEDPVTADRPVDNYEAALAHGADGLTVGLLGGEFRDRLPAETAALHDAAAGVFEDLGARVVAVDGLSGVERVGEWTADLLLAEAAAFHAGRLAETPEVFAEDVLARLRRGAAVTGPRYAEGRQEQRRWTREVLGALERVDLLIAPATPGPAPLLAESDPLHTTRHLAQYVSIFGFARVPSLAVPVGFTDGLPVSMQLVGRHFDEAMLLRAAHAYQQATDWHLRRPG